MPIDPNSGQTFIDPYALLGSKVSAYGQPQQQSSPMPNVSTLLRMQEMLGGSGGGAGAIPGLGAPGSGAAVSGGYPSSGAFGVGSGAGGAPGGAAGAGSGSTAAGGGGAGAFALPALYALLIGAGKMAEYNAAQDNPDNPVSMAGMGLLGPSINQYREDPKLLGLSLLGLPFLTPFFANEDAKKAEPEFAPLWRGAGLPLS
jgi:hypothetical protein